MCIRQQSTPLSATSPAMSGSKRKADTSLTMDAPAASARSATSTFVVSIEMSASSPARPSITGSTRRSSSSAPTGAAPGRVDSPPMSRMSAPSAASWLPCATAWSGSRNSPPSEKESGVTLTTPMTLQLSMAALSSPAQMRWLVDGMNVIGSRPDGWWRDRRGAMRRLVHDLAELDGEVTVVLDGAPFELEHDPVEVVFASRRGPDAADDDIAARVEADRDPASLTVVTSDADLERRVRERGANV